VGEFDRPQFADVDAWGLTHIGKVRQVNQDHYFVGSLTRGVTLERSSLGENVKEIAPRARLASLAVVADGVGSSQGGGEAARVAVQALVHEVSRSFHDAQHREADDPEVFSRLLQDAALACHHSLVRRGQVEGGRGHFATTLTLFLGLWPHAYLLQVGDSRCYVYRDGELTQISRDQTVAQELVDQGVMSRTTAEGTRWAHVLSSAIGGESAAPVVTRIVRDWGTVVLLCSDGLTKHVSDERIAERTASMTSARQLCEDLLQDALDGGGTDNITLTVGRTLLGGGG
jgi:PPM family protein phosphatase